VRAATALALAAIGAILTFAVSAHVPGISLRLTGVIVMLTAAATTLLPPSPVAGWLRRRGGPAPQSGADPDSAGADLDAEYPAYLLQDPAVLAAEVLNGIRADSWPQASTAPDSGAPGSWTPDSWPQPAAARAGSRSRRPAGPRPLHSVRFDSEDGVG
jgi:hypothetical protein